MNQAVMPQVRWVNWLKDTAHLEHVDVYTLMTWLYPLQDEDETVRCFDADFFQDSPSHYQTTAVHVMKSYHHYGNYFQAEMLSVSASRPLCCVLAMLALQTVFTVQRVALTLNHPESGIQEIYFELQEVDYPLQMKAVAWHYEVESVRAYLQDLKDREVKFNFYLSGENFARQGHWFEDRNQLYCVGSAAELTAWASVLLNMAHAENKKDEVAFESDVGFGGVHAGSAELYLYLPSSLGYALEDAEYATKS